MKYFVDEEKIRNEIDNLTVEDLKNFAFKYLREKELGRLRKQQQRILKKERVSENNE